MNGRITTAITAAVLTVVLAVVIAAATGTAGDATAGRSVDGTLEPPHRVRPIAATRTLEIPVDAGLQAKAVTAAAQQEERRMALFVALVEQARQQDAARAAAAAARSRSSARAGSGGGSNGSVLDCIRHRESRGNYGVTNRSSGAAGAYQFMPGTWNTTARSAGRSDLVGVNPANASPSDQDAMARQLMATQGLGPWGGGCR
jgi:soluble lytic murein transglycosylase-like protein